ncbi:MAG: homoserine O-succinyltransferase [Clostridiales bacterium]|uniref:homoserine O-acetyltransferase MetA n=1 Tax=Aminipila sp. TaxID=2060095 RepID=UPI001D876104|nr:homoserine O-succinyltransferase [Aminipila sp.]MBE6033412.1 homoserine O-succinyltransferase [Clostridiales bacterium]
MPLIIPDKLPAGDLLQKENIFVMHDAAATKQDIRPLRILMVNLMPDKAATETQIARVLANSPLQVELTLVRMGSHEAKNVLEEYLDTFYKTFDEIKEERFDGMILTGAPVETLSFEEVDYWEELCEVLEYSKTHVYSSMYICWGAQAGLYYHYGIDKYPMKEKMFGVFEHKVVRTHSPLMRGFDDIFWAPHSRYTKIRREDIEEHSEIRILAESEEAGPHILATDNGRQIFIIGHQEYDRETLGLEYYRDLRRGSSPVIVPKNYFKEDQPGKEVLVRWRGHASMLFANWLNYYVYQETPYDLAQL